MWEGAWEESMVLNVPLREIVGINSLEPAVYLQVMEERNRREGGKGEEKNNKRKGEGFGEGTNPGEGQGRREGKKGKECLEGEKAVFVVENSGVFSQLLDEFQDTCLPPLVCTHGQFKLAAFLLLDLLVKNDNVIYYSGDFDPEGLQMAQRLLYRYPKAVRLWRYGVEEYEDCISSISLPDSRLNKLKGITVPGLSPLKEQMEAAGKAGYQEEMIHLLIEDIRTYLKSLFAET